MKNNCKKKYSKEISNLIQAAFGAEAVGERMRELLQESLPLIQQKEEKSKIARQQNKPIGLENTAKTNQIGISRIQ